MEELVSIIIPAYNVEKYIERCLESVIGQTYKNIEIIVIDDGSTDNTLRLCESYMGMCNDGKLKLIHQENTGRVLAQKKGVNISKGEYIYFVDADDWIEINTIERLYEELIKEHADVVQCRFLQEYPDRKNKISSANDKKIIFDNVEALENMNYGKTITPSRCDKLFKRNLVNEAFFCDSKVSIGEDYCLVTELLCAVSKVVFIPDILYHYCLRSDNTSYTGYTGNGHAIIQNYTNMKKKITENYPQIVRSALAYWALQEMAVVISMIKADRYDNDVIQRVQNDLKAEYRGYCRDKKVPMHLKICCLLMVENPWILIFVYKHLFKWRYRVKE